jgi:phosphoglycolate phosphatase
MQAIVFDLDGVLVDTPGTIADLLVEVLAELDCRVERDHVLRTIGRPLEPSLAGLLGHKVDDPMVARAVGRYRERFLDTVAERGPLLLHAGVADGLDRLADGGMPVAVGTSKVLRTATAVLEATGIATHFPVVVTFDMVANGKPHPDTGLLAAELLGVPASACGYVGDALGDVAMAKAAGMGPIGVSYGVAGAHELAAAGAEAVYPAFPDVVDHVLAARMTAGQSD